MTVNKKAHIGFLMLVLIFGVVMVGFFFYLGKKMGSPLEGIAPALVRLKDGDKVKVAVSSNIIEAEVVKSEAKIKTGLGGKQNLDKDAGMLFIFNKYDKHIFWNKDMLFPIDILWIRGDKVVDIYENMPTYERAPDFIVAPKYDANYVLEVNAGFVKEHKIKIGNGVRFFAQ